MRTRTSCLTNSSLTVRGLVIFCGSKCSTCFHLQTALDWRQPVQSMDSFYFIYKATFLYGAELAYYWVRLNLIWNAACQRNWSSQAYNVDIRPELSCSDVSADYNGQCYLENHSLIVGLMAHAGFHKAVNVSPFIPPENALLIVNHNTMMLQPDVFKNIPQLS